MTTPLRTAVIGTGYLGRFHAQKYAGRDDCSLVGVCDHNADHAHRVATELNCPHFLNHRDLLDKVEAVSIATSTPSHHAVAKDFLSQGIHVLLEKPITTTVEQADELIALAKEHNALLQIGHLENFNNAIKALRPKLTTPRFIRCQRLAPFQQRGTDVNVILDLMIHDIELALSMVNASVTDIQATGSRVLSDHIDIANARLLFDNGCMADLSVSRVNDKPCRLMHVFQEGMSFDVDMHHKRLTTRSLTQGNTDSIEREVERFEKNDALKEQIANFCENIKQRNTPSCDGQAGRDALAIAIQISEAVEAHNSKHALAS